MVILLDPGSVRGFCNTRHPKRLSCRCYTGNTSIMTFPEITFKGKAGSENGELNVDVTEFVNDVSLSFLTLFGAAVDPVEISEEVRLKIP